MTGEQPLTAQARCGMRAADGQRRTREPADAAEAIGVLDADTPAVRVDETALAKILKDDVDRLARETNEIAEIALVEAQRDEDPCIVGDAVVRREIEKRMGDAGGSAVLAVRNLQ